MNDVNNGLIIFEGESIEILFKDDVNVKFDGECLFNGKQVCNLLMYSNDRDAINRHIRENQKLKLSNSNVVKHDFRKLHNTGETFLTEKGVMKLIINSKLPKADEFEDLVWNIVSEVQKCGKYDTIEQQIMLIEDETERNLTLSIYKLDEILKTNPNDMLTGIMRNNKQLELNQYKQSKEITLLKDKQVEQDKLLLEQKEKIDNMHLIGDRKQFTNEVKSISRQTGEKHDIIYGLVYKELENKYGINLETRSKNRKQKIQDERLNSGKRPYSPSTLNGKAGKLVIADEEDLWRELGICLYNVRDTLLNK